MIHVTVLTDSEHRYVGIDMEGHAGLAEDHQEGQELVCAAVSALTLNMANSVERFTDDPFQAHEYQEKGSFSFRFSSQISSGSELLMNSFVFGLMNIEESYGEPYIKIRIKEV